MTPFHRIKVFVYEDATTGRVVESIPVREFYEYNPVNKCMELVRQYPLHNETELNPGFGKPPQGDAAFPKGQRSGALI